MKIFSRTWWSILFSTNNDLLIIKDFQELEAVIGAFKSVDNIDPWEAKVRSLLVFLLGRS